MHQPAPHRSLKLTRRKFIGLAMGSSAAFSFDLLGASGNEEPPPAMEFTNLRDLLTPVRERAGLPAIAAGVMRKDRVIALGCVGVRKVGAPARVTMLDKFHTGSCTKAMTATLAARLVEQGRIRWDSTLAEIFPERSGKMQADYRTVTLELLLRHRAGMPRNSRHYQWQDIPMIARRLLYLDSLINHPPEARPGTQFSYSNAGYVAAGAMLERVTGRVWEDLMREHVFRPLGMRSAGFGSAASAGQTKQPWGHRWVEGKFVPTLDDGVVVMGPPGRVHCSISDFLRFADLHASGGVRPARFLQPATVTKLHAARTLNAEGRLGAEGYALGWSVVRRPWAKGLALTHKGSNGANLMVAWVAPNLGLSIVVACNGSNGSGETLDGVALELAQRFA